MNTYFYPPKKMAKKRKQQTYNHKNPKIFSSFLSYKFISKSVTTTACLPPSTKQKHRGDETDKRVYALHHKIRHLASNPAVNISGKSGMPPSMPTNLAASYMHRWTEGHFHQINFILKFQSCTDKNWKGFS